jgi:DNA invertase Pin-like site-specific DNA recombinase
MWIGGLCLHTEAVRQRLADKPVQEPSAQRIDGRVVMRSVHENVSQEALTATKDCRARMELVRLRADLLRGKDRLLMTMHLENGNTVRQIAELLEVSEASISRRINGLIRRLTEGQYIRCLRYRDKFTKAQLSLAKEHFLFGVTQRKIASRRRCSVHQIRRRLEKIEQRLQMLENTASGPQQQGDKQ